MSAPPRLSESPGVLRVRGAREHNLQGVDLDLPKHRLLVFTGVSGSGKSSLAFDTLYAEGQRRYVESLSAYARQFLGQMDKPRYEAIRGLSPTIAIEQKTVSSNPRSTVGTVTEVYDYLRVLFARVGVQHCTRCGRPVGAQTAEQVADTVLGWPEGTRFSVMAPVARRRKGRFEEALETARREGFVRVRLDGAVHDLAEVPDIDGKALHDLELVVDRLAVRPDLRPRLVDSVELAFRHGEGRAVLARVDTGEDVLFSERHHCASCDLSFPEPTPQRFSFNSPLGMCTACHGLGDAWEVEADRVVEDDALSLRDGAIPLWANALSPATEVNHVTRHLLKAFEALGVDPGRPFRDLPPEQRHALLHGLPEDDPRRRGPLARFEGAAEQIGRRWRETRSEEMRVLYGQYFATVPCEACGGSRLRDTSRAVRVADRTLPELVSMPVHRLRAALDTLPLDGARAEIARELLREIAQRLRFLDDVGVGYLMLARAAGTLSGGESQRIRLASQIGTELTGVLYVLDEPSIGLHPRDNQRLLATLEHLRDVGNTVLVVEHDAEIIAAADWVVDFGPGAGVHGGRVVAQGPPEAVAADPASLTGAFLSGRRAIAVPSRRREPAAWLRVEGAREHNLRALDVAIPLGVMTVVTGVSGAGKSTLVGRILLPALQRRLHGAAVEVGAHDRLVGLEHLDKVIAIDQRPIGRTPRSNPATYTKVFDEIRKVFASTREARMYGYGPSRFSFNVKGGRCETCGGDGAIKVEMHFLPDVYVTCEACAGHRFNEQTLRVHYKGRTIAEVLEMTVAEALEFFEHHKKIRRILQTLHDVGLGYVHLGQPSDTLSGGEAQRVKLSRELARVQTGRTLYVLDEPSTGLHFADVERLLAVLDRLVEGGNSVLVVEHNLDVVKVADHVIDLGPEGGEGGGLLVAAGTPEEVAAAAGASQTGAFLAPLLAGAPRVGAA